MQVVAQRMAGADRQVGGPERHDGGEADPQPVTGSLSPGSSTVSGDGGEAVRLMRVLRDLRVTADVIVVSERYAEDWRDVRGTLVHAALSQGRVLAG